MTAFEFLDGFILKSFENGFNEMIHKIGIVFVQTVKIPLRVKSFSGT